VNWLNLKKLDYQLKEEREISSILGIEYNDVPFKGREGLGGGGSPHHRK